MFAKILKIVLFLMFFFDFFCIFADDIDKNPIKH